MLKMYQAYSAHAGNSPDFWEENWAASQFEESVRFMAVDPLRPLFEKYLRPESRMLEGGCGMGNYIAYYSGRGHDVIGLDFAQRALKTLQIRQPDLKLIAGDVSEMPFPDNTFDLYYSGGVVEHFESGAMESLREARRVLKKDGVLLISVPYYNPLRKVLSPFRKEWRKVRSSSVEGPDQLPGMQFFQYAYTRREFSRMLADSGLKVISTQGYAVIWGLYELPFLNPGGKSEFAGSKNGQSVQPEIREVNIQSLIQDQSSSLLKRLAVLEDATVPVLGAGVRFLRWAAANMMMYVCQRDDRRV